MRWNIGFHLDSDGEVTTWWVERWERGERTGCIVSGDPRELAFDRPTLLALADLAMRQMPEQLALFLPSTLPVELDL